jgi:hypothetical protein
MKLGTGTPRTLAAGALLVALALPAADEKGWNGIP